MTWSLRSDCSKIRSSSWVAGPAAEQVASEPGHRHSAGSNLLEKLSHFLWRANKGPSATAAEAFFQKQMHSSGSWPVDSTNVWQVPRHTPSGQRIPGFHWKHRLWFLAKPTLFCEHLGGSQLW